MASGLGNRLKSGLKSSLKTFGAFLLRSKFFFLYGYGARGTISARLKGICVCREENWSVGGCGVGEQAGRQADRQTGRQADRQTGRQADRQTGRQAGGQPARHQPDIRTHKLFWLGWRSFLFSRQNVWNEATYSREQRRVRVEVVVACASGQSTSKASSVLYEKSFYPRPTNIRVLTRQNESTA
ncbi:hypothetical protein ABE38_23860 [Brevibacillus agri]|nr:hypothetical protein [Brevibacillus agri]